MFLVDYLVHQVQTPNIDGLVQEGIKLDRHYVHKFCSPTRCAIQSGRAPIHVNVINAAPEVSNPLDPVAGYAGMARNMTGIAEVMKRGGYKTHFAGKWDVGMATGEHTPVGRGYDTTLHYYHHVREGRGGAPCEAFPRQRSCSHNRVGCLSLLLLLLRVQQSILILPLHYSTSPHPMHALLCNTLILF